MEVKKKSYENTRQVVVFQICVIFSVLSFLCSANAEIQITEKLSAGVFANEIKGPRIYESLAALTFEFQLPSNAENNFMVFDYACPDAKFSTEYSCPIFYYLHKIRDELKPFVNLDHLRHPESASEASSGTGSSRDSDEPDDFEIPECDQISRHFLTPTMTASKLQRYQSHLRACVDSLIIKTPIDLKYNQTEGNRKIVSTLMVHGFVESYFKLLPEARRVDKAILLNAVTLNNALGFTQYVQEAQLWTDAATACSLQHIPSSFISSKSLQQGLEKLERLFIGKSTKLVIPSGDGHIGEYFKAPLADCVMTKQSFFIRILVPVKRIESRWKLFSLTPIPFIFNDGEDKTQLVCAVKEFPDLYTFDMSSNSSFPLSKAECDPKMSKLCHSGDVADSLRFYKKTCASEILQFQMALSNLEKQSNSSNSNSNSNSNSKSRRNMSTGTGSGTRTRGKSNPRSSASTSAPLKEVEPRETGNKAQNLFERNLAQDLVRQCDLHCEDVHLFRTPIIFKVSTNKFYVAGQTNESLVIHCQSKVELVTALEEGALEITLPCYCSIMHKTKKYISTDPCGSEMKIVQVKPIHLAPPPAVGGEGTESASGSGSETVEQSRGGKKIQSQSVEEF